jgi:ATP phosphoribosyltransferase regulatory subunit
VLARARRRLSPFGAEVGAAIERLEAVIAGLEIASPGLGARVSLDLGEPRGLEYYTGIRFRIWAPGVSAPIVRGGRYDAMLAHYGADLPATGLAVDLDGLGDALHAQGAAAVGDPPRGTALFVASVDDRAARRAAHERARAVRAQGQRAWVDIEPDPERAARRAGEAGANTAVFVHRRGRRVESRELLPSTAGAVAEAGARRRAKKSTHAAGKGGASRSSRPGGRRR